MFSSISFKYLSTSDHVSSVSTTADCPSACVVNSYSVQMSQARLSGLGIAELFGNKSGELRERQLRALEMRHRIEDSHLSTTIENLEDIMIRLAQLQDFIFFSVLDQKASILGLTERAVSVFIRLTVKDISENGGVFFSNFKSAFFRKLQPKLSYLLSNIRSTLSSLVFFKDVQLEATNGGVKLDWFLQVANESLQRFSTLNNLFETFSKYFWSKSAYLPKFPIGICHNDEQVILERVGKLCKLFQAILENIENSILSGNSTLEWTKLVDSSEIDQTVTMLTDFESCSQDYEKFIVDSDIWMKSLESRLNFKNFSFDLGKEQYLLLFSKSREWLDKLKTNYSRNLISKINLVDYLHSDVMTAMTKDVENVIEDIVQHVVSPIQDAMFALNPVIVENFNRFIAILTRLSNFTANNEEIEDFARSLQIWQKPLPNLEVPGVSSRFVCFKLNNIILILINFNNILQKQQ